MSGLEEASRAALDRYLKVYFTCRDLDGLSAMLHPNMNGVGTGADEFVPDLRSALAVYKRDIQNVPDEIVYTVHQKVFTQLSAEVVTAVVLLDIKLFSGMHVIRMRGLRMSVVFADCRNTPLVAHVHISTPSSAHEEGESYPMLEIRQMTDRLEQEIKQRTRTLTQAYAELEHLLGHDSLTGLLNRRKFEEILEYELGRCARYHSPLSIILIDLDNFKSVNDHFGHLIGDKVLQEFSSHIQKQVRDSDVVARWGGEEFLLVLPETGKTMAVYLAEKLRLGLEQTVFSGPGQIQASFGVAEYRPGDDVDNLFKRADAALYDAKQRGRNQVCRR